MSLTDIEFDILDCASEDYYDLFELLDFIRGRMKGVDEKEILAQGRSVIKSMIDKGWLELHWCPKENEDHLISKEQAEAFLADDDRWYPTKDLDCAPLAGGISGQLHDRKSLQLKGRSPRCFKTFPSFCTKLSSVL
jgi:hypothetical protein